MLPPSSSSASLERGLNAPRAAVLRDTSTRLTRCRRGDSPPEVPLKIEDGGEGQAEAGGGKPGGRVVKEGSTSTELPEDEARRACSSVTESSRADEPANAGNDTPPVDIPFDRPWSEGDGGKGSDVASTEIRRTMPGSESNGKSLNQEEEEDGEEARHPRRQAQAENDCLRDTTKPESGYRPAGSATATAGGGRGNRAGGGRRRERRRSRGMRLARSNTILKMMTADGHPLVASKSFPSLPGVDEHQRPPFWLAKMHDNMRENRQAPQVDSGATISSSLRCSRVRAMWAYVCLYLCLDEMFEYYSLGGDTQFSV